MTLYELITLLLSLLVALIVIIEKWDLLKKTYDKIKTLFTIYIMWSKEDRIRAAEISKKYQLPSGWWIKDESKIVTGSPIRRRRH